MDATLFLGIDVGSTTVKVAILDSDNNVLFSDYERHFANIRETLLDLMTKARAELGDRDLHPMITGSGGMSISKYIHVPFVQEVISWAYACKALPHFLFCQVQCVWFYVEVFDSLGLDFCTR